MDSQVVLVEVGETILYQFVEDISITIDAHNTYCSTVKLRIKQQQLYDETLVLTLNLHLRFKVKKEVFLIRKEQLLQKMLVSLAFDCLLKNVACLIEGMSLILDEKPPQWPYKLVRQIQGMRLSMMVRRS